MQNHSLTQRLTGRRFPARLKAASWVVGLSLSLLAPAQAEVFIVTHKDAPDHFNKAELIELFMGKSSALPDGRRAVPIDQPESSPVREEFYYKLTGKSPAQVRAYWAKLSFTGKGTPPRTASNGAEARKTVASTPGAISYVSKADLDPSVKVVFTLP